MRSAGPNHRYQALDESSLWETFGERGDRRGWGGWTIDSLSIYGGFGKAPSLDIQV